LLPLKIHSANYYNDTIKKSSKIIKHIDEKDVDILALSFKEDCFLWSEDKHFRNIEQIKLIRTKDLL
jgi:predicted nucleic acid-binding protein